MRNLFVNKINKDEIFTLVQDERLEKQNSKPSILDVSQRSEHAYVGGTHSFHPNCLFVYPLKTSQTSCFLCFQRVSKRKVALNGLAIGNLNAKFIW